MIFSLIGWVALIVCGGCGYFALGLQLALRICLRPGVVTKEKYKSKRAEFMRKTSAALEKGREIRTKMDQGTLIPSYFLLSPDNRAITTFRNETDVLKREWKQFEYSFKNGGQSIIVDAFLSIIGVILCIMASCWIIQVISNDIVQIGQLFPFLSTLFSVLDLYVTAGLPILSGFIYYGFSLYLIFATLHGCMLITRWIPFLAIVPLTRRDTPMGSILFNFGVVLVTTIPVQHMIVKSLHGYFAQGELSSKNYYLTLAIYMVIINNIQHLGIIFSNNIEIYLFVASSCILGIGSVIFACFRHLALRNR